MVLKINFDYQSRIENIPGWIQHPEVVTASRELTQQSTITLDHPSPRPLRKLHPFKSAPKPRHSSTPPDSPTQPGRKFR